MGGAVDPARSAAAGVVTGRRRRDRGLGLVVLGGTFALGLVISWKVGAGNGREPHPPSVDDIVGFPSRVEAVSNLARARGLTRRTPFRGFVAEGVSSDGTLDVGRPGSKIRYVFQSARGQGPQPPVVDGRPHQRTYCGKQTVHIDARGIHADPDQPMAMCPRFDGEALPEPTCGMQDVWAYAIDHGAPAKGHALLEYYPAVGGPAWRFQLPGTAHRFSLTGDCSRVLEGRDIYGSVP